jgi:hypothetical protein
MWLTILLFLVFLPWLLLVEWQARARRYVLVLQFQPTLGPFILYWPLGVQFEDAVLTRCYDADGHDTVLYGLTLGAAHRTRAWFPEAQWSLRPLSRKELT